MASLGFKVHFNWQLKKITRSRYVIDVFTITEQAVILNDVIFYGYDFRCYLLSYHFILPMFFRTATLTPSSGTNEVIWIKLIDTKPQQKTSTRKPMMTSLDGAHFPLYWPFVRGIHRSLVNSPRNGQLRGSLMFFLELRPNRRLSKQSKRR